MPAEEGVMLNIGGEGKRGGLLVTNPHSAYDRMYVLQRMACDEEGQIYILLQCIYDTSISSHPIMSPSAAAVLISQPTLCLYYE